MAIKRMLVPLFSGAAEGAALDTAVAVARQFDAHIEGMYVRASPDQAFQFVSSGLDTALYGQVLEKLHEDVARDDRMARGNFEDHMGRSGVVLSDDPATISGPSASWQTVVGDPADLIARHGGAFDLVVTAHPARSSAATARQIVDAAIFNTARPVLLAAGEVDAPLGRSVLVAWNRGIQGSRALVGALPFLADAERVVILMVTTGAKQGPEPEDIAANLAWHGVAAEVKRLPPDYRPVAEVLTDEAHAIEADLLVMGAYSQSRMRERILGGVTKDILTDADLPVLLAR